MAAREDPGFAKAIGADAADVSNIDEPMTLASVLRNTQSGKFSPIKFCILS